MNMNYERRLDKNTRFTLARDRTEVKLTWWTNHTWNDANESGETGHSVIMSPNEFDDFTSDLRRFT